MRHAPRLAPRLALTALLAVAASSLVTDGAGADDVSGDAARCAAAFARTCARCHRNVDAIAVGLSPSQPQTVQALDRFLATHFASDGAMRQDIIAYLLAR